MQPSEDEEIHRYVALIEAALSPDGVFVPEAETAAAVQVERGAVFARYVRDSRGVDDRVDRLIEVAATGQLAAVKVVDRIGHHRPVYRPLLVYAWLQAYGLARDVLPPGESGRWAAGLRSWCEALAGTPVVSGAMAGEPGGAIPAARGGLAAERAWVGLALGVAGRVFGEYQWVRLGSTVFQELAGLQTVDGAWLAATAADNPETHWFHELVVLHAAASYAVSADDKVVAAAAARNAAYHQRETQPDHATNQPWGLAAFAWHSETRPLADALLHAMAVHRQAAAAGADGVPSLLLADALYCLRRLASRGPARGSG